MTQSQVAVRSDLVDEMAKKIADLKKQVEKYKPAKKRDKAADSDDEDDDDGELEGEPLDSDDESEEESHGN